MLVKINFYNIQPIVVNRVLNIILMSLVLSCNQLKSSSARTDSNKVNPNQKLVKADLIIPAIGDWELRGISAKIVGDKHKDQAGLKLTIIDHDEPYSFVAINNIKIGYMGGNYRITIVAKNTVEATRLGLRVQEAYPNRFDAVYDLKNQSVVGTFKQSEFVQNEVIRVEPLEGMWCRYTLDAEIKSSYFRLIFGPTDASKKQVSIWEAYDNSKNGQDILILPESLKVQELEN